MQIQYRTTKHRRDVSDSVGERLCRSRIADRVDVAQPQPVAVEDSDESFTKDMNAASQTYLTRDMRAEGGDISPRTGQPKRPYRRRDQQAEE